MTCAECQVEELAVAPRQPAAVLPWHDGARHLVGWWDMQKFDAGKYLIVAGNLAGMAQSLAVMGQPFPLSEQNRTNSHRQFLERAEECREIGLIISAAQFETAAENLTGNPGPIYSLQIGQIIVDLQNLMMNEMKTHLFLWVKSEKAKYYEQEELFGKAVADKFSSTEQDIRSAGNCYASDNNTACVFHCMRVLEKGLHAFADHLGVPFTIPIELQNWQNIIEPIEKEISQREKTLPRGTAKSEELKFLSGAAAQFRYFKEAWRNHVAHSRVTYDDIEALRIMSHVHQFMEELATHGLSEP